MNIMIVSGFLGAGKTTFIKELIRRSGARPVIMENEYGENNLDARELKQSIPEQKEMKILEFMEGCVCCTMKDSFVNSVLTIFSGLDPEYLVIEPTGVGRLSSVLENLRPILHDNIRLLKPVVVLSPHAYRSNLAEWPGLYKDQIAHAGIVVFSKGEQADPDLLENVASSIRLLNPLAEIVKEHYSQRPDVWWLSLMNLKADEISHDTPPPAATERFQQISLRFPRLDRPVRLISLMEDALRGELGHVVRAKGVLPVGGEMLRFDLADGLYALTGAADEEIQCVFIGENLRKEEICRRLGTSIQMESFKPAMKRPKYPQGGRKLIRRKG